jgi:outer membrane protein assembly factor BamB
MIISKLPLRAHLQLSAVRNVRCALVGVSSTFALAACFSDARVVEPTNAVVDPAESPVAARIKLTSSYSQITVLGSSDVFHTYAFDGSGAVLCAAHYINCAPQLFMKRIAWKTGSPGALALVNDDGVVLNGSAYVTALAPGRHELTASVDGVEATVVVDVVERARVAWLLPTRGASAGVAIGEDGTIYEAGYVAFQAIGPEGNLRWSLPVRSAAIPAIAQDGTIYLPVRDGEDRLIAIDPAGTVLWATPIDRVWSAPAIGPDGTIYQNTSKGALHAVDPSGRVKWRFEASGPLSRNPSSPAIAEDGTIYFASEDQHLYALDPDGRERWRFPTAGPVRSPSIGLDGTIYFGSDEILAWSGYDHHTTIAEARMFALNPDGSERWSAPMEGHIWSGPSIGFDGSIYTGTNSGFMYAFGSDGSLLWKVRVSAAGTPTLAGDGSIYAGAPAIGFDGSIYQHGRVAALDGSGAPKWEFRTIAPGPVPYLLRAFDELGTNNGGYQSAPWPQERGERANTGRARRRP